MSKVTEPHPLRNLKISPEKPCLNEHRYSGDSNINNSLYHAELRSFHRGCHKGKFDTTYTKLGNLTDNNTPLTEYDLMQENGVIGRITQMAHWTLAIKPGMSVKKDIELGLWKRNLPGWKPQCE